MWLGGEILLSDDEIYLKRAEITRSDSHHEHDRDGVSMPNRRKGLRAHRCISRVSGLQTARMEGTKSGPLPLRGSDLLLLDLLESFYHHTGVRTDSGACRWQKKLKRGFELVLQSGLMFCGICQNGH